MIMFAFKVAPALICGNTVVLKSSEKAPLSSLKLSALMREAGVPAGVVNVVSGFGAPTGMAISLHMKIRKISFTGSVATGRKILKMAADSNLKQVSLELGGKSPALIFADADVDAAARYTHFAINHNSGQHCQANSRVLVHESIVNQYLDKLKALMSKVCLGNPADTTTFQGPQVDTMQLKNIQRLIAIGKEDGTLVYGGNSPDMKGSFIQPTILLNVPQTSAAYREEIFGPVVIVNTFRTEAEALSEANNIEFGLFCKLSNPQRHLTDFGCANDFSTASVYTQDFERALRVSKALEAGAVGINCSVPVRAVDMAVGGWKQSGTGRELGLHGLNLYTELKTIFMKFGLDRTTLANDWHSGAATNGNC